MKLGNAERGKETSGLERLLERLRLGGPHFLLVSDGDRKWGWGLGDLKLQSAWRPVIPDKREWDHISVPCRSLSEP